MVTIPLHDLDIYNNLLEPIARIKNEFGTREVCGKKEEEKL